MSTRFSQPAAQMFGRSPTTRKGQYWRGLGEFLRSEFSGDQAIPIALSLAIVALITVLLFGARGLLDLDHVAFAYLIPVIVAATRWGIAPAIISAAAGVAATAFFFYEPIYDIRVYKPAHIADLFLFGVVAFVTGQLANRVREHEQDARRREEEIKALYFFSRRLAVASGPTDIYAAIQDHLSAITACRIVFFAAGTGRPRPETSPQWSATPGSVQQRLLAILDGETTGSDAPMVDPATGANWLIRILSQRSAAVGIVAIELGEVSQQELDAMRQRVDSALAEAAATLERIDVAHAIGEARIRAESETLREAVIGSVSHDLRTPLASILGSASVLAQAPLVMQERQLADLVDVIRDETQRLNSDIQNLLDASRITSDGVRPQLTWAEPSDIVNAAVERQHRRLSAHCLDVRLAEDLPLVRVDPVLIEQATSQIIDNAAKYSPAGSAIAITAQARNGHVRISVADRGVGLTTDERTHLFERFYRGSRHQHAVSGSGLGLWIAQAFTAASGCELEVASDGVGLGTIVTLVLPAPQADSDPLEHGDE